MVAILLFGHTWLPYGHWPSLTEILAIFCDLRQLVQLYSVQWQHAIVWLQYRGFSVTRSKASHLLYDLKVFPQMKKKKRKLLIWTIYFNPGKTWSKPNIPCLFDWIYYDNVIFIYFLIKTSLGFFIWVFTKGPIMDRKGVRPVNSRFKTNWCHFAFKVRCYRIIVGLRMEQSECIVINGLRI